MAGAGFWRRARYRFDNLMARGVGAQILLLALCTVVLVGITVVLLLVLGAAPTGDGGTRDSVAMLAWKSLMHTMDAGTLGEDGGSWTFLLVLLFATVGGLFVVSALIGVLNQGFGAKLDQLRRGRSVVVESRHTVILGWGPKVFTLLKELCEANRGVRNASVVILATHDKIEMDGAIAAALKGQRLRVVTRHGSPMAVEDLALASLATSKAVIVLAEAAGGPRSRSESDTVVLRTLLAIKKVVGTHPLHIVAELFDAKTEAVARMVAGERAGLLVAAPLVSRLLVQTGRQSGLSIVYTELLDFVGSELYVTNRPGLAGTPFREAVFALGTATLLGVFTASGDMLLPPPFDYVFGEGDLIVVISSAADQIILDGAGAIDERKILCAPRTSTLRAERTLVLGASPNLALVLKELNNYVAPTSETVVYGERALARTSGCEPSTLPNMTLAVHDADITDRAILETLALATFDHVLVLSEQEDRTEEMADARTTITLLHLRDLAKRAGTSVPITSEILDIQSRDLATVAEADDFIVSNSLVSLMISQLSENPHLVRVFADLFSSSGFELYVKPMAEYLVDGEASFATLTEAALRRNEIAIGYRIAAKSRDAGAAYGVVVNPPKRATVRFCAADRVIVLAEG